jgi:hypothetical protein
MTDLNYSIVFPNVHEYMRRGMEDGFDAKLLQEWRDIASGYAEVALFWEGNEKLVLSPKPLDSNYISYIRNLLGYGQILTAVPKYYSSETSSDFVNDPDILALINSYVKNKDMVHFLPWGATEGIYTFLRRISENNPQIVSQELPAEDDYWTSLYYDSKMGFKELCRDLQKIDPNIQIPKGYCCGTMKEALAILRGLHKKGKPCVLKANSGAGGFGNVFISKQLLNEPFLKVVEHINESIEEMPYFRTGTIIVEEFVDVPLPAAGEDSNVHSCFMSGCITPDGNMKVTAGGIDIRDRYNYYSGARLGRGEFPEEIYNKLEAIMHTLGQAIANNGYRGQWGVNFMITKDGSPLMIELNPRRCGESHVHGLGKRLYGNDWMKNSHVLNRLPLEVEIKNTFSVDSLLNLFEQVNKRYTDAYVIPTQIGWLKKERFPGMGYVIFGEDKSRIEAADKQLLTGLMDLGIKPLLG